VNPTPFINVLSTILNDLRRTADPVAGDARHVVKGEVISDLLSALFDLLPRGELPIIEKSI
jgi:hypothetical protein